MSFQSSQLRFSSNIFNCKKDKQPSQYLCLDLTCKKPRFACSKCLNQHKVHQDNVILVQNVIKPTFPQEKIACFFDKVPYLISAQSEGIRTAHRLISQLNQAKEKLMQNIEYVKSELMQVLDVRESELNTDKIAEMFITPKEDSQEQIENILKKIEETQQRVDKRVVQLKQRDMKGFFERQLKKVVSGFDETIKQMDQIIEQIKVKEEDKGIQQQQMQEEQVVQEDNGELDSGSTIIDSQSLKNSGILNQKSDFFEEEYYNNCFAINSQNLDLKPHLDILRFKDSFHNSQPSEGIDNQLQDINNSQPRIEERKSSKGNQISFEDSDNLNKKDELNNKKIENSSLVTDKQLERNLAIIKTDIISENDENENKLKKEELVNGQKQPTNEQTERNRKIDEQNKKMLEAFLTSEQKPKVFAEKKPNFLGSFSEQAEQIIEQDDFTKQLMIPLLATKPEFVQATKLIKDYIQYSIEFSVRVGNENIGVGIVITEKMSGKKIKDSAINVGNISKDQAEYTACVYGLYMGLKLGIRQVVLMSDSVALIDELAGKSNQKNEGLDEYFTLANRFKDHFNKCLFQYIQRNMNISANKLADQALSMKFV